ncbi:uncharacterized protein KIAA1958-like [Oculina patagonica]
MSEEELDKSVEDQKSINTSRSTQFAVRTWQAWLEQSDSVEVEKKTIEVYTKQELSQLLKHFYWEIRTAKGEEFEPSSLKTIQRGLDRYLQEKNAGFSIIRDEDFAIANKALDAKVKFLKKSGKGNKLNAAQPLSAEMIEEMWEKQILGKHDGEALTNANFLNISQHFGFRGRQEHHQLKFGDFKIVSTSAGKYVEWSVERLRKISANERKFNPKMWATNHEERCPVMLFEEYIAQRPSEMCLPDSPFWIAINYKPLNGKLLKNQKMGIKKINGLMKAMVEKISDANGQKYTNHSNRKTLITTLLENNVERSDIGQLSGHRNVQSLDSYASTPEETQRRMSSMISRQMCSTFQDPATSSNSSDAGRTIPTVVFNATSSQNSLNSSASGLFYGARFENATINVSFNSGSSN